MTSNPIENQEPLDRMIDVFLEEILAGRKPPDLTARILAARRAELHEPDARSSEAASSPSDGRPSIVAATPIRAGMPTAVREPAGMTSEAKSS